MKSNFIKILSLSLCLALVFGCTACGKRCGKEENGAETTGIVLAENGGSAFRIVVPETVSPKEELAAAEFNEILYLSAKTRLPVVKDSEVAYGKDSKFILIGQTKFLAELGVNPSLTELGEQGYIVRNADNSLVITGAAKNGYGTLYGVYEFMARQVDFESYSDDETYVREYKSVELIKIDLADKPDIQNCTSPCPVYNLNTTFRNRNRYVNMTDIFHSGMNPYHSSFVFLPKENEKNYLKNHRKWYSEALEQLCWRAQGDEAEYAALVNELFEIFLEYVNNYDTLEHIGFSMMDTDTWCTCAACDAVRRDYGANSASCIMLLNDLSVKFEEYFKANDIERNLDFMFLAYKSTSSAPARKIKKDDGSYAYEAAVTCRENVYPLVCTFWTNRAAPLTAQINSASYSEIEAWDSVCSKMGLWTYSANFKDYLAPYDAINCIQENYRYLKTKNAAFLHDEGQDQNYYGSSFSQLKYWLNYKLGWDTELDVESLINEYFERYFRQAAEPMRRYFDSFRLALTSALQKYNYNHLDNNDLNKKHFSYGLLQGWQKILDEAYASIEPLKTQDRELYEKLYKRITVEKVTVDYTIITLYGENYSLLDLNEMKKQFKVDCALAKISYMNESANLDKLWS